LHGQEVKVPRLPHQWKSSKQRSIVALLCVWLSIGWHPVFARQSSNDDGRPAGITVASSDDFERFVENSIKATPAAPSNQVELVPPGPKTVPPPYRPEPLQVAPPQQSSAKELDSWSATDPNPSPDVFQSALEDYVPPDGDEWVNYTWEGGWWESPIKGALKPLLTTKLHRVQPIDLEQLIWQSMQYSMRVQSILKMPKIQRSEIDIARGDFDPMRYARSNFKDTSDPVGNTLTTGGPNRLNDYFWENAVGIRDRNQFGGKTDFGQAIDARDSNSLFFRPNNQVDSKLTLNYSQPLMRGSGVFYNTSSIRISQIKTEQELAIANTNLQQHARTIHSAYWELLLARFQLAQVIKAKVRFKTLSIELENRRGIDVLKMHTDRAESMIQAMTAQDSELRAKVRGYQADLARLVGSPEIQRTVCDEMIPLTRPIASLPPLDSLDDELYNALMHRGELQEIRSQIETESVRKQIAANELRPTLDLVVEGYVRGLAGEKRLLDSLSRQFDSGAPSYSGGFSYQSPYKNRVARANLQGRAMAMAERIDAYEDRKMEVEAQVYKAIEMSKGTYQAILASLYSARAVQSEVENQRDRLEDFFNEGSSPSSILNELFDSENRLLNAEKELATRQIEHMQALIQIKYESGTLLTIARE
jgi:outer membrane protein TolC